MEIFYKKPNVVEARVDISSKLMVIDWLNLFDENAIKDCTNAQVEQIRRGVRIGILDLSNAKGVISRHLQDWLGSEIYPKLTKLGIKAIITIPSNKSSLTKLSTGRMMKTGSQFGFDMYEVVTIQEALDNYHKINTNST